MTVVTRRVKRQRLLELAVWLTKCVGYGACNREGVLGITVNTEGSDALLGELLGTRCASQWVGDQRARLVAWDECSVITHTAIGEAFNEVVETACLGFVAPCALCGANDHDASEGMRCVETKLGEGLAVVGIVIERAVQLEVHDGCPDFACGLDECGALRGYRVREIGLGDVERATTEVRAVGIGGMCACACVVKGASTEHATHRVRVSSVTATGDVECIGQCVERIRLVLVLAGVDVEQGAHRARVACANPGPCVLRFSSG